MKFKQFVNEDKQSNAVYKKAQEITEIIGENFEFCGIGDFFSQFINDENFVNEIKKLLNKIVTVYKEDGSVIDFTKTHWKEFGAYKLDYVDWYRPNIYRSVYVDKDVDFSIGSLFPDFTDRSKEFNEKIRNPAFSIATDFVKEEIEKRIKKPVWEWLQTAYDESIEINKKVFGKAYPLKRIDGGSPAYYFIYGAGYPLGKENEHGSGRNGWGYSRTALWDSFNFGAREMSLGYGNEDEKFWLDFFEKHLKNLKKLVKKIQTVLPKIESEFSKIVLEELEKGFNKYLPSSKFLATNNHITPGRTEYDAICKVYPIKGKSEIEKVKEIHAALMDKTDREWKEWWDSHPEMHSTGEYEWAQKYGTAHDF